MHSQSTSTLAERRRLRHYPNIATKLHSSPHYTRQHDLGTLTASPPLILPCQSHTPIRNVMAPMVAASDYPFRLMLRQYNRRSSAGGDFLSYTQMLHARNFVQDVNFRKWHCDFYEAGGDVYSKLLPSQRECLGDLIGEDDKGYLRSIQEERQQHPWAPLMVQLAGHEVDVVVQAALVVCDLTEGKIAGIDLNCGCPQTIAKKGNYGAFLMERDSDRVREILAALRKYLPPTIAVSAKIRLPPDDHTLKERIPRLLDTGISYITVHGRTLHENKTKVGAIHADRIKLAIDIARRYDPTFPVVANGGMETYQDVQHMIQYTGASAAMSSEALLETPNLFSINSQEANTSPQGLLQQQTDFSKAYLDLCETVGPPLPGVLGESGSFGVIRGHLFKFLHRYLNHDSHNFDLRKRLAGSDDMQTIRDARSLVDELHDRYSMLSDNEWDGLASSNIEASWYRRHRKPERKVHQRHVLVNGNQVSDKYQKNLELRKQEIKNRIAALKSQRKHRTTSGVVTSI